MDDHQAQLREVLEVRTVAQFAQLSQEDRSALYRRHLVKHSPVLIEEGDDDDEMNPEIASGLFLRQQYFMGSGSVGKKLARGARDVLQQERIRRPAALAL